MGNVVERKNHLNFQIHLSKIKFILIKLQNSDCSWIVTTAGITNWQSYKQPFKEYSELRFKIASDCQDN